MKRPTSDQRDDYKIVKLDFGQMKYDRKGMVG